MMTARRTYAIYTVLKIYMSALLSQLSSGAASSDTSSASASTGSTASKSSRPVHINRNVPKEKMPRKALSKMSKAQIRHFRAPALLFSYLLSEKLIQRLAILTFPFRPTVRTCTEDEHSGRARRRKRHRFVQHIFAVYIGHVSVFQS